MDAALRPGWLTESTENKGLLKALGKIVEILSALLPDCRHPARRLLAETLATTTGRVGQTSLLSQRLEVAFLDVNLGANVSPTPTIRQIPQSGEGPSFDLLPCIHGKQTAVFKRLLQLVEPVATRRVAVPVHAQDEDVGHSAILAHDFPEPVGLQRFAHSTEERIHADFDSDIPRTAKRCGQPSQYRAQEVLILAEVLRDDEHVQESET